MQREKLVGFVAAVVVGVAFGAAIGQPESDNIGHTRHHHAHNAKHPSAPDGARFTTSRTAAAILPLPEETDAFTFVVFGDRTGGPVGGVSVLADAVRDTNLFEPDMVMTVGDLVEGYNETEQWLAQMREFKAVMDRLICPWFPVVGNHDVYWRGKGEKPVGENEKNFETHFGPLWYAFEHKNCWFIALHSDEGNPETGEKNFEKPECQRMSDEQFAWLKETLSKAKGAEHVFLFLHHPRWLGGRYGDDWEKVHRALVEAGNVTAVFAGHIHRMRYDGPRDGIEYVTLATVGGSQGEVVPATGWLHQFHIVTVRKSQVAMASVPVGEVMDVREITGEMADEAARLSRMRPVFAERFAMSADGAAEATVRVTIANPSTRGVDVTLAPASADSRWFFGPDHDHAHLAPGGAREFTFRVRRARGTLDAAYRPAELVVDMDLLMPGFRYALPTKRHALPVDVELSPPPVSAGERALSVDGKGNCLKVESGAIEVPDGPLTLECWFNARAFDKNTGLVCKTESSEFGLSLPGGAPSFDVHLGGSYATAKSATALKPGQWHHVAGVYDGREVRLYVDGALVSTVVRSGKRRTNDLPLIVGGDVTGEGKPASMFDGLIDGVRLSKSARYSGEEFEPVRRAASDAETVLLLNMDGFVGPWAFDESSSLAHAVMVGEPTIDALEK